MLNKIIDFSLKSRLVVLILTAILLAAGVITLLNEEIDIFPDLNAPTVVVMTEAPGLAPEEVESTVSYPIETAVNGASNVRRVRSTSTTGFSVVTVEFDWNTDIMQARQIVTERIAGVSGQLPEGVEPPVLGPQSSILGEMLIIGLTADSTSMIDLRTIADRVISPRLLALGGVSQVSVIGGDAKEYQILLSPAKMDYFDVTLNEVIDATENINDNIGGGVHYQYGNEYIIKGDIRTNNPEEIAQSVVRSDERGTVTLADIAEVKSGAQQPRLGCASVKAQPAVLITVTKQPHAGTIQLTEKIENQLSEITPTLPADVKVSTDIFRQSDFIDNSISNLQRSLLEGSLFVVIVLFFFLMNLRTTVVSIIALPLSIIITILVLHFMGLTINTMSLGGIAIAIGSLVDDAIVDVENVYKRLRANNALPLNHRKQELQVVYHASAEVRMPIFNSSLIIIASFLPLFFLTGMEGRMLIPLGISFIVALIASTLVALTVTPVLCSLLLSGKENDKKLNTEPWASRKLKAWYRGALRQALAHTKIMYATVTVLFIAAIVVMTQLGTGFMPSFNEGSFTINVSTLPGISLDESDHVGRVAEELIMSVPEVQTVARKTGRAELDEHSLGVNVSEIEASYRLTNRTRDEVVRELREKLKTIPGANIEIGQPISHRIDAMLSGTESQIAIKLFGEDLQQLFALGNNIKSAVASVHGVEDVNIEQQMERPQLDIRPRRQLLARYGITISDFRKFLDVALSGMPVSRVYEGSQPFDLTLKFDNDSHTDIEAISNLMIDTNQGKVPLSNVAEIISTTGPNTINRENVKRRIVISANVSDRDLGGAVADIKKAVAENVTLPENYYVVYSGQFENAASATRTLIWTTIGALLIIIMLLYKEFGSMKESLIILVNMPLAMIGGVFLLALTGGELNIPAIIGFISLLGITTRNGMLLISRYNNLAQSHVTIDERILIGSTDRLLPIIMTVLTSALALIPLAINGHKPGNEIQSPMAIVILGGLVTATALNIFIVPALYKKFSK